MRSHFGLTLKKCVFSDKLHTSAPSLQALPPLGGVHSLHPLAARFLNTLN